MIVVVTGLVLKSVWQWPRFSWHAVRSFTQAQKADGNILARTKKVDGVYHTITAWRDGPSMKAFAKSGAHLKAEAIFSDIAMGRVAIFEADQIPTWDEALGIWKRDAKEVGA